MERIHRVQHRTTFKLKLIKASDRPTEKRNDSSDAKLSSASTDIEFKDSADSGNLIAKEKIKYCGEFNENVSPRIEATLPLRHVESLSSGRDESNNDISDKCSHQFSDAILKEGVDSAESSESSKISFDRENDTADEVLEEKIDSNVSSKSSLNVDNKAAGEASEEKTGVAEASKYSESSFEEEDKTASGVFGEEIRSKNSNDSPMSLFVEENKAADDVFEEKIDLTEASKSSRDSYGAEIHSEEPNVSSKSSLEEENKTTGGISKEKIGLAEASESSKSSFEKENATTGGILREEIHLEEPNVSLESLLDRKNEKASGALDKEADLDENNKVCHSCSSVNVNEAREIEIQDTTETRICQVLCHIENLLIFKKAFYALIQQHLGYFIGDSFIEARITKENKILIKSLKRPELSKEEQDSQVNASLEQCFKSVIKHEVLPRLFEDEYFDAEIQKDFMAEVQKLLTAKFNIPEESVLTCEILDGEVIQREYLPNTFLMIQNTTKLCYFQSTVDAKACLYAIIDHGLIFDPGVYNFLVSFSDFKSLLEEFKKKSANNSIVFNETESKIKVIGRSVDICYLNAWVNHIESKVMKLCINSVETIDLNKIVGLIKLIVSSTGIRDFFLKIENPKCGYIYAIDANLLEEVRDRIDLTLLTYTEQTIRDKPALVSFLQKFKDKIRKDFPFVYFQILDASSLLVQSDSLSFSNFITLIENNIRSHVLPQSANELYKIADISLNSVSVADVQNTLRMDGYFDLVYFLSEIFNIFKNHVANRNSIEIFNLEHTEQHKDIITNLKLSEIIFEFDYYSLVKFKLMLRRKFRGSFLELSRVSNDMIVYKEDSRIAMNLNVYKDFISSFIHSRCAEYNMQLNLGPIVKDNTVVYEKLIEKLTDWKNSVAFEWEINIPVVFEMCRYDLLKVLTHRSLTDVLLKELMAHQTEVRINFQTTCLVNGEFVKRIEKAAMDKTWKIKVEKGFVVFTGPYLYYLFFNILFEQHLFTGNYTLPGFVFRITGFEEYAKVFQRSRKLFDEFKECLPDDIKDCRCEMRAFADELIIEPSLELIKKPSSGNLKERYNQAFKGFVEQRIAKKEIPIVYGQEICNDCDYNLLKHFVSVLNAEIRLTEKTTFRPVLAIVEDKLKNIYNIVIIGLKGDIQLVSEQLTRSHFIFRRVQKDRRHEPIPSVYRRFQQFKRREHQTRLIDYLFFRTYFDIRDNGVYQKVEFNASANVLRNQLVFNHFKAVLAKEHHLSCWEYDFGKPFLQTTTKTFDTVRDNENRFLPMIKETVKIFDLEFVFYSISVFKSDLRFRLLDYLSVPGIVLNQKGRITVKSLMTSDKNFYRELLNLKCEVQKSVGNRLFVKSIAKLPKFATVFQSLNEAIQSSIPGAGFIRIKDDLSEIVFELPRIDAYNVLCAIEDMLRRVRTCVYEVDLETFQSIARYVFPRGLVDIALEYHLGHMVIYSYDNDQALGQFVVDINRFMLKTIAFV